MFCRYTDDEDDSGADSMTETSHTSHSQVRFYQFKELFKTLLQTSLIQMLTMSSILMLTKPNSPTAGRRLSLANCLPPWLPSSTPCLPPGRWLTQPPPWSPWPPSAPTLAPARPPAPVSSPLPVSLLSSPATQYAGEWPTFLWWTIQASSFGLSCSVLNAQSKELSLRYLRSVQSFCRPLSTQSHLILSALSILSQQVMSEKAQLNFLATLSLFWRVSYHYYITWLRYQLPQWGNFFQKTFT